MFKKIILIVFAVSFITVNAQAMGRKKTAVANGSVSEISSKTAKEKDITDENTPEDSALSEEEEPAANGGDFIYVEGDVSIKKPNSSVWEKVTGETELVNGSGIKLESDSYATVKIDEDKELDLNEDTMFEYSDTGKNQDMDMFYGSIKACVDELSGEEMTIRTPIASVAVRGTEFAVLYEEENSSDLEVYDGEVAFSSKDTDVDGEISVKKDSWAKVKKGEKPTIRGKITKQRKLRWMHLENKRELFQNARELKRLEMLEDRLEKKLKVVRREDDKETLSKKLKTVSGQRKKTAKEVKENTAANKKLAEKYKEMRKKNAKSRIDLIMKQRKAIIEKNLERRKEKLKDIRDQQRK